LIGVPFKRSWGSSKWCDRHQKWVCEVSLHLQLELNTLDSLSVSTGNGLKDWGQHMVGLYLKTGCFWTYIGVNCLPGDTATKWFVILKCIDAVELSTVRHLKEISPSAVVI
jgi:hypothetical protein